MEKCQKTKLAPHLTYYQIQVIKGLIDEEVGGVAKMALLPYLCLVNHLRQSERFGTLCHLQTLI